MIIESQYCHINTKCTTH